MGNSDYNPLEVEVFNPTYNWRAHLTLPPNFLFWWQRENATHAVLDITLWNWSSGGSITLVLDALRDVLYTLSWIMDTWELDVFA